MGRHRAHGQSRVAAIELASSTPSLSLLLSPLLVRPSFVSQVSELDDDFPPIGGCVVIVGITTNLPADSKLPCALAASPRTCKEGYQGYHEGAQDRSRLW